MKNPSSSGSPAKRGSKAKLRDFFLRSVGMTLHAKELQAAAGGASEWGRRLRELRDEEGYQIKSHKDDPARLRPGEYRLDSLERLQVAKRSVDKKLRAQVMAAGAGVCQWCGAVAGLPHPSDPTKRTTLQAAHIVDRAKGGTDTLNNLVALCSMCNEGATVETVEPPRDVHLYSMIRRAPMNVQRAVYERLRAQFDSD